jgi:hypothetical protein
MSQEQRLWRRPSPSGFSVGGGGSGTPVDLLLRLEDGSDESAITVANLDNSTLKTSAAAGTWSIPVVAPIIDTEAEFLRNGLRVGDQGLSDASGTRGIRCTTASDQVQIRYTLTTNAPVASVGYIWRVTTTGATFNYYNWGDIHGSGGDYCAFHHRDFTNQEVGVEDVLSDIGTLIPISTNTWYWVTMLYDNPNNAVRMRLYDAATLTQVGSVGLTTTMFLARRLVLSTTSQYA